MQLTKGNKYTLGVVISVLLLVANQIFIQYFLSQKEEDAKVINIAGKQRMLSQKINLLFYQLQTDPQKIEVLDRIVSEWTRVHNGFLNGDAELGLTSVNDDEIRVNLSGLDSIVFYINSCFSKAKAGGQVNFDKIGAYQADFLQRMNTTVKLFERNSTDKLHFIMLMEFVLLLFSITIIVLEVVLIYKPIAQELDYQIHTIEQNNE